MGTSSYPNGNFTHSRVARLCAANTRLFAICAHSLYRRRTGSSTGVTRRGNPLPTSQTPANKHSHYRRAAINQPPPPPPCLLTSDGDPLCLSSPSASAFWPGWPSLTGVEGMFIHGQDRRPSPGEGFIGGTGRERTNTHYEAKSWG